MTSAKDNSSKKFLHQQSLVNHLSSALEDEFDDSRSKNPAEGIGALSIAFLSNTTAHGLPKIMSGSNYYRKMAWTIITIGAFAYFFYMMYWAFVTYSSRPSEITINFQVRNEAEFPAVTVCNMNPLKKSLVAGTKYNALVEIDRTYSLQMLSSIAGPGPKTTAAAAVVNKRNQEVAAALEDENADSGFTLANSDFMTNAANDYDFESFMSYAKTDDYSDLTDLLKPSKNDLDLYGHQAQELIVQCSFDQTNCSYLDFTKVYNNRYGNCYVFNMKTNDSEVRTTTVFGSRYGLRLTLNLETTDYLGLYTHETGARIAVHPPDVTGFPEDEGVNAASAVATSIGVTASSFTRLPHPYASNCSDGSNHNLLDNNVYTVWSCMLACLQNNLKRQCGCKNMAGLPETETACSLTNATQEVCRQMIYRSYNLGQLDCNCPLPCNQLKYNTKVSTSDWPSETYVPILWSKIGSAMENKGFRNIAQAKESLARVHVYLEHFIVKATEEFPSYTEEDLMANAGGYLGLFIGVSCCTALEFVEYLLDILIVSLAACASKCCKRGAKVMVADPSNTVQHIKLPPPSVHPGNSPSKVGLGSVSTDIDMGLAPPDYTRW